MAKIMSGRYFLVVSVLLIIIAGSAGFAFVLRPSLEVFRIARDKAKETAVEVKNLEDALAKMQTLTTQATLGSSAEVEKLKGMFISSPELAFVLTSLPKYAAATRFLITSLAMDASVAPRAGLSAGPLRQIPIQVQLKGGGYGELKEFLKLITTSTPIYEVTSFTFDPRSASLSINLNAFSIEEDTASAVPLDPAFFEDPRFKALHNPSPLPKKEPVGKTNPFAAPTN
ncbi:MAG: hypothetical protein Q7S48_00235 [bacterium]|nr:hypothetical protein [bacterium]